MLERGIPGRTPAGRLGVAGAGTGVEGWGVLDDFACAAAVAAAALGQRCRDDSGEELWPGQGVAAVVAPVAAARRCAAAATAVGLLP